MQLTFDYDPETDTATLRIPDRQPADSEHFEDENIVVDYDKNGNIAGIEIFDWKTRKDLSDIISVLAKHLD